MTGLWMREARGWMLVSYVFLWDLSNTEKDSNLQAEILSSGIWQKNGSKVTLEFPESKNTVTFI